jgi:oligoribonuclease
MADDLLLWLDLETTGADESKDSIIEIGCVLTTTDLVHIAESSWLVEPTDEALGRLLRNDIVRRMHETNGLLHEITKGSVSPVHKPHEAAKLLLGWLRLSGANEGSVVLAGSGVAHFDRRFISRWMPQVDRFLRYWCIDIGVVRRAHEMWTGTPSPSTANEAKTHRALDDARCHLAEARAFRQLWLDNSGDAGAPGVPTTEAGQ